jgi:hypothetical protein
MSTGSANMPVLRVTPMMVRPDIAPVLDRFEALGFERVETGDAGCVGLRAGHTAVILASVAFVNGDYEPVHAARLTGRTIEYIHVSSVDHARGRLAAGAIVLQDVRTRGGTRELLVEDGDDLFILAEKVA